MSDAAPSIWPTTWLDCRNETAALDFIGDVHGCAGELEALLAALGYRIHWQGLGAQRTVTVTPPPGRKVVLLGDIVDRGPRVADALRLAMAITTSGAGYLVVGNHDHLLIDTLREAESFDADGIQSSLRQLRPEPFAFKATIIDWLLQCPSYIWFAGGEIVASHAGLEAAMIGENDAAVHDFATRRDPPAAGPRKPLDRAVHWSEQYAGNVRQVYGHYRVDQAVWRNGTMCLDTSCVYGGSLSALRYPEGEVVAVPARSRYARSHFSSRPVPEGTRQFISS